VDIISAVVVLFGEREGRAGVARSREGGHGWNEIVALVELMQTQEGKKSSGHPRHTLDGIVDRLPLVHFSRESAIFTKILFVWSQNLVSYFEYSQ
jgi:hypothetical protein